VSYSGGYLASVARGVVFDLSRMDAILEINTEDMFVRVQPGVTWAALNDALRPKDVRTPFWGVQSGRVSTVGGAVSQNASYYGSGVNGGVADSVLSLRVVLADGRIIESGSAAIDHAGPVNRNFGPDLTGLFLGDCGALGIKGEICLRLMMRPLHEDFVSASFPDFAGAAAAMSAIARLGVSGDGFMMDPALQAARLRRVSIAQDLESLSGVARNSSSLAKGLWSAAKVAIAGRDIVDALGYSIHMSIEHRYADAVVAAVRDVTDACVKNGGRIVENSIPKVVRGTPFGPLNIVIGPEGQRWLPMHGIVPHSRSTMLHDAIRAVLDLHAEAMAREGVECVVLASVVGAGLFQIDPVLNWPDEMYPLHEQLMDPSYRRRLSPAGANPAARAVVDQLRNEFKAVFARLGATHMQLGRSYPYRERLGDANWRLLSAIKAELDPENRMNPGALGLGAQE
jgi:FAD/FMN-containing dehydrogenase